MLGRFMISLIFGGYSIEFGIGIMMDGVWDWYGMVREIDGAAIIGG